MWWDCGIYAEWQRQPRGPALRVCRVQLASFSKLRMVFGTTLADGPQRVLWL